MKTYQLVLFMGKEYLKAQLVELVTEKQQLEARLKQVTKAIKDIKDQL